jgi:hypothetical protein
MMAPMISKRRLAYGFVAVLTAVAILSFVLPYIGAGHSGLTTLLP